MQSQRNNRPILIGLIAILVLAIPAYFLVGGDDDEGDGGATLEATEEPTPTTVPNQEPAEQPTSDGEGDVATTDDGETGAVEAPGETEAGEAADETDATSPTPDPEVDLNVPAFNEQSKISTVGLDEVFFGMTADEAAAAAGTQWESDGPTANECWFATPVNGPVGVSFMMWNGGVERVDVETELITTRSGAGVGSTGDELAELFGDLLDNSDPALLSFVPADEGDADFRIFFEMVDGVVASYRAGRLPMVELPTCP